MLRLCHLHPFEPSAWFAPVCLKRLKYPGPRHSPQDHSPGKRVVCLDRQFKKLVKEQGNPPLQSRTCRFGHESYAASITLVWTHFPPGGPCHLRSIGWPGWKPALNDWLQIHNFIGKSTSVHGWKKWCLVLLGRKEWQRKKYYPPSEKGTWNYVELRLLICFNPFRWCLVIVFSIESFVVEKIEKASHMSAESQCWIWSRVLVLHFGIHVAAVSERCQRRWIPKITRNQTTVTTALKKGTWLAMSHTCASTL